jgi:hypothetical protein
MRLRSGGFPCPVGTALLLVTRTARTRRSPLRRRTFPSTRRPIFVRHLPVAGRLSNDLASARPTPSLRKD